MDENLLDSSPKARGKRLKYVRRLSGITAETLAEKIGYTRQSVSYWENAANSGLSNKGARKIVNIMGSLGVHCDMNWLLYGIGETASWIQSDTRKEAWHIAETNRTNYANQPALLQEIELFKQTHSNAVIAQVKHNKMQPMYKKGDWIGGCFEPIHAGLLQIPCIIKWNGLPEVRILIPGDRSGVFHLAFLDDTDTSTRYPIEKNVSLDEAATISRVWRD